MQYDGPITFNPEPDADRRMLEARISNTIERACKQYSQHYNCELSIPAEDRQIITQMFVELISAPYEVNLGDFWEIRPSLIAVIVKTAIEIIVKWDNPALVQLTWNLVTRLLLVSFRAHPLSVFEAQAIKKVILEDAENLESESGLVVLTREEKRLVNHALQEFFAKLFTKLGHDRID